MTIPSDMSAPVKVPSGSTEAGSKIYQGSVSLQDYPEKGDASSDYDGLANPKPEPVLDTIVITEVKTLLDANREIAGIVNTKTHAGQVISGKRHKS